MVLFASFTKRSILRSLVVREAGLNLAEFGQTLWGAKWSEPLATALQVTPKELFLWHSDPQNAPPDIEDRLSDIASQRVTAIQRAVTRIGRPGAPVHCPPAMP